ncbi:MAG: 30S ribosomal protein S6 [Candidatus Levybacteria bacterium]|nr:30S ribosomal protein S6 [Candidatus Levybacteria bacterium]
MRLYDLVLVLKTSLSDAQRKKLLDDVRHKLVDVRIKEEEWGQKPMAYKIKQELAGFYHVMHLESEKGLDSELDKRLRANENILRHLLLRTK